MPMEFILIIWI